MTLETPEDSGAVSDDGQALLGKKELAAHLGWSRPRLDHRLKSDPTFPIAKLGSQRGGWAFDPIEVEAYLASCAAAATADPRAQLLALARHFAAISELLEQLSASWPEPPAS